MTIHKILIAVDDSKYAQHAAEFGFDLARTYKAEVGLVSIVEPIIYPVSGTDTITGVPVEGSNIDEAAMLKIQSESAENMMQQTKKMLAGDLQVTQYTEFGLTADGILKCGKEFNADMIVVGTHSRTGLGRLFMGSVAEDVVRHSHVPVLVVPLREQ
ncbi:MAG: putative universal stress protein [Mucilaginibacter sp.]|nr:putative universal stress protein [Mucilaginibacter sp.]